MRVQLVSDSELRGIIDWLVTRGEADRVKATDVVRTLACANRAAWLFEYDGSSSYIGAPLCKGMTIDSVDTRAVAEDYIGRLIMNCSSDPSNDDQASSFAPLWARRYIVGWLGREADLAANEAERLAILEAEGPSGRVSPGGSL